jgi:hypothetical protein
MGLAASAPSSLSSMFSARSVLWALRKALDLLPIDRATHQLDRRDAVREMVATIGDDAVRAQYRIDQLMKRR